MKQLKRLKKEYDQIEIPQELASIVQSTIQQTKKVKKRRRIIRRSILSTAVAAILLIGSLNMIPPLAQAMATVPVLGSLVEVFTIDKISTDREMYHVHIETPAIEGFDNSDIQSTLNQKYLEENKALYEQFQREMEALEKQGGGTLSMDIHYEVLTDTDQLLTIARSETSTAASSATVMKYDTIDKKNQILITLPSLFKSDDYIQVISSYLQEEMKKEMAKDEQKVYFTKEDGSLEFEEIHPNQKFYITAKNKLVIVFDEYEIAPGYMGTLTFEIPTERIENLLVSRVYIR